MKTRTNASSATRRRCNELFTGVQIVGAVLLLRWIPYRHLPHAGIAACLIGFVAVLMSVHTDVKGWQTAFWMALIAALLATETRAIGKDRAEDHAELESKFARDVEAVTGSKSYPNIYAAIDGPLLPDGSFLTFMEVFGSYPMREVSGQIRPVDTTRAISEIPVGRINLPNSISPGAIGLEHNLSVGTYQIDVYSFGGNFTEMLTLRRDRTGKMKESFKLYRNGVLFQTLAEGGSKPSPAHPE